MSIQFSPSTASRSAYPVDVRPKTVRRRLLMEGTARQVPFLANLVTMTDPTSPRSYLNHLRFHQRRSEFFSPERFPMPCHEYDHYCHWAAEQLASRRFDGETRTHGVGAWGLTLGPWHAATILSATAGRTLLSVAPRQAFTTFGAPRVSTEAASTVSLAAATAPAGRQR